MSRLAGLCSAWSCLVLLVASMFVAASTSAPSPEASSSQSLAGYGLCSTSTLDYAGLSIQPRGRRAVAFDPRGSGRLWLADNAGQRLVAFSLGGEQEAEVRPAEAELSYGRLVGEQGEGRNPRTADKPFRAAHPYSI